ncbi:hypothetical protein TRFO_28138 [Tritrichomonas foetus]|uniref:C2H2-type domain-containing protein n=1 Tax=Tritrichomonas foetus TaxID=1144522 RepID=A0A1J4K3K1_9EUKA|nr:hypothetical protein TRFO_28138 [Tritrichomonas foetus]|eukprot:OHT04324.1 hypothetical protein TRFO_28138 [Tritrichomonas foetus]
MFPQLNVAPYPTLPPFSCPPCPVPDGIRGDSSKIDWELIQSLDPVQIKKHKDTNSISSIIKSICTSFISSEDLPVFSNPLTPRLFQLCQVTIQYLASCHKHLLSSIESKNNEISQLQKKVMKENLAYQQSLKLIEKLRKPREVCPTCGKKFKIGGYLDQHFRLRHPNLVEPWMKIRSQINHLVQPQDVQMLINEIAALQKAKENNQNQNQTKQNNEDNQINNQVNSQNTNHNNEIDNRDVVIHSPKRTKLEIDKLHSLNLAAFSPKSSSEKLCDSSLNKKGLPNEAKVSLDSFQLNQMVDQISQRISRQIHEINNEPNQNNLSSKSPKGSQNLNLKQKLNQIDPDNIPTHQNHKQFNGNQKDYPKSSEIGEFIPDSSELVSPPPYSPKQTSRRNKNFDKNPVYQNVQSNSPPKTRNRVVFADFGDNKIDQSIDEFIPNNKHLPQKQIPQNMAPEELDDFMIGESDSTFSSHPKRNSPLNSPQRNNSSLANQAKKDNMKRKSNNDDQQLYKTPPIRKEINDDDLDDFIMGSSDIALSNHQSNQKSENKTEKRQQTSKSQPLPKNLSSSHQKQQQKANSQKQELPAKQSLASNTQQKEDTPRHQNKHKVKKLKQKQKPNHEPQDNQIRNQPEEKEEEIDAFLIETGEIEAEQLPQLPKPPKRDLTPPKPDSTRQVTVITNDELDALIPESSSIIEDKNQEKKTNNNQNKKLKQTNFTNTDLDDLIKESSSIINEKNENNPTKAKNHPLQQKTQAKIANLYNNYTPSELEVVLAEDSSLTPSEIENYERINAKSKPIQLEPSLPSKLDQNDYDHYNNQTDEFYNKERFNETYDDYYNSPHPNEDKYYNYHDYDRNNPHNYTDEYNATFNDRNPEDFATTEELKQYYIAQYMKQHGYDQYTDENDYYMTQNNFTATEEQFENYQNPSAMNNHDNQFNDNQFNDIQSPSMKKFNDHEIHNQNNDRESAKKQIEKLNQLNESPKANKEDKPLDEKPRQPMSIAEAKKMAKKKKSAAAAQPAVTIGGVAFTDSQLAEFLH